MNKIKERNMNKIKEKNTFSIEVYPDESSPAHQDHADPSILDSSDMDRQQGELIGHHPTIPSSVRTKCHLLKLKPDCLVILLRNFDQRAGHCNGTKYTVVNIHSLFNVHIETWSDSSVVQ